MHGAFHDVARASDCCSLGPASHAKGRWYIHLPQSTEHTNLVIMQVLIPPPFVSGLETKQHSDQPCPHSMAITLFDDRVGDCSKDAHLRQFCDLCEVNGSDE
jgi:hypothetical protein